MLVRPQGFVLPDACGFRREPTRPEKFRDDTYEELFDWTTVFYDIVDGGRELLAVSPPLMNFLDDIYLKGRSLRQLQNEGLLKTSLEGICQITKFDRSLMSHRMIFGHCLEFKDRQGKLLAKVSPAKRDDNLLAGKNVLHTIQKDEPLEWIVDWVRFNVAINKVNAVSIYDNGSTVYTPEELLEAIKGIAGVDAALVVPWNYRYGPQGGTWSSTDSSEEISIPWDSNFAQSGAMDDLRMRFAARARGVLNLDVDEYLVPLAGENIFDAVESKGSGVIGFAGEWIENAPVNLEGSSIPHVWNYCYDAGNKCNKGKWIMNPKVVDFDRCRPYAHRILMRTTKKNLTKEPDERFVFFHMRGLNRGWKYTSRLEEVSSEGMEVSVPFANALMTAFGEEVVNPEYGNLPAGETRQ